MAVDIDAIKKRLDELSGKKKHSLATPEPYWKRGRTRERPFERLTHHREGSLLAEYHPTEFDENGMLRVPKIKGWIIVGKRKTKKIFGDEQEHVVIFSSNDGKQDVTPGWLKNMLDRGLIRVEVY